MSLKQKRNPNVNAQIHLRGVTENRPSPLVYVAGKYKLGPSEGCGDLAIHVNCQFVRYRVVLPFDYTLL